MGNSSSNPYAKNLPQLDEQWVKTYIESVYGDADYAGFEALWQTWCRGKGGKGEEGPTLFESVGGAAESADLKVKTIREIAKALKEHKVIQLTASPDTARFADLVKEVAHKLPDPKRAARGVRSDKGIPQKLCVRLVSILNDKINASISTDAPIEHQCQQAFAIVRLLLLGAGTDAFSLHNELKRSFEEIKLLSALNKEAIDTLEREAAASKDKAFQQRTKATVKLMKSLQKSIDSIVQSVVSTLYVDLDKDYKDILTVIENSKSNKEALQKLGLPHDRKNLSKMLGHAFSEVTNLSVVVNQVALALKRLHMKVDHLKNSKTFEEFEKAAAQIVHSVPNAEKKKFFKALEVVRKRFGMKDKLVEHIKGGDDSSDSESDSEEIEGGPSANDVVEGDNVSEECSQCGKKKHPEDGEEGCECGDSSDESEGEDETPEAEGGVEKYKSKYAKRVKDAKVVRVELVKQFVKVLKRHVDKLFKHNKSVIADFRNQKIKVGDNTNELFNALKQVQDQLLGTGSKYVSLVLIGVVDRAQDKDRRSRFIEAFRHLQNVNKRVGSAGLLEQNKLIDAFIADIDRFYDTFQQSRHASKFAKGAADEPLFTDTEGDVKTDYGIDTHGTYTTTGGAEYDDIKKAVDQYGRLTDITHDLNRTVQEIKYYISIHKIRDNLKFSAKDIEMNQGDYMKTLGKSVARKLDNITEEYEKNIKALEQLRDSGWNATNPPDIPGYDGANLYDLNAINFNTAVTVGGTTVPAGGEKLFKDVVEERIKFCREVYKVKLDFYKVLEAIEIYLTKFNDGLINNPEDIKDIESMLKDGEIVYDWFNIKAGDALLQAMIYARNAHPRITLLQANGTKSTGNSLQNFVQQAAKNKLTDGNVYKKEDIYKIDNTGAISNTKQNNTVGLVKELDPMFNIDGRTRSEKAGVLLAVAPGPSIKHQNYPNTPSYRPATPFGMSITAKIENGKWVVDNQFKNYIQLVEKSYERMDVLKNLISTFMMIGNKFGSTDLNKVVNIPFGEIYRRLVKFLVFSSLDLYKETVGDKRGFYGGASILKTDYTATDINNMTSAQIATAQNEVNSNINELTKAIDAADLGSSAQPTNISGGLDTRNVTELGPGFDPFNATNPSPAQPGDNIKFGDELTPGSGVGDKLYVKSIGGYWRAELELFSYLMNAMSAKVFMVMGMHDMMNKPYKTDVETGEPKSAFILDERRYDVPVRLVLGGADKPEIIDDALELYVRLPLLVEFYRDLLTTHQSIGNDGPLTQDSERIGLIADFENVWRDLFHFFFIKHAQRDHSDFGNYELYELVHIINELYRAFKGKSSGNVTTVIVNELIHEINGRIGIITHEDHKEFYDNVDAILRSMTESDERDTTIDFKIIPDQDNTYASSGPSGKYKKYRALPEITSKQSKDHRELYHHRNLLEELLDKYYSLMNNPSTYRMVNDPSKGMTLVKRLRNVADELKDAKSNDDKFNVVFKTVRTEHDINDVHVLIHIVIHELIGVPLNTVVALHSTFRRLGAYYNNEASVRGLDANKKYDSAGDLVNNFTELMKALKVLSTLNNSYGDYISVSVSKEYLRIDFTKLTSHLRKVVELLRKNISRFEGVLPPNAPFNIIENYRKRITSLEELLINQMIEEKKRDDKTEALTSDDYVSFNKINKHLENIWIGAVKYLTGTGAGSATPAAKNDVFDLISENYVFRPNAAGNRAYNTVFNGVLAQLLPGHHIPTGQNVPNPTIGQIHLLENINLNNQNNHDLVDGAAVNDLNRLITYLIHNLIDESNHKIYKELINELGNSTFSEALFNGQNLPNVGRDGSGVLVAGNPTGLVSGFKNSSKVLYHSTASILAKLLASNLKNKTDKAFLWESLADVPLYVREKMRINLPVFISFFKRMLKNIDFVKDVLNVLKLEGTGGYGVDTTAAAGINHNQNNTQYRDRIQVPPVITTDVEQLPQGQNNYNHRIAVLDSVKNGVNSIIRSCEKVLSELGDSPKYGQLYDKYFEDYKNAYGKEPACLYSNLVHVLNGRYDDNIGGVQRGISEYLKAFFPTHNVGMDTTFKYKNGVRAVFNRTSKMTLKDFPYLNNLISQYNGYYKVNQKLDTSNLDELISLNTELLRYIHHSKVTTIDRNSSELSFPIANVAGSLPIGAGNDDHLFFYVEDIFRMLPDKIHRVFTAGAAGDNDVRTFFLEYASNGSAVQMLDQIVAIAEAKFQKDRIKETITSRVTGNVPQKNLVSGPLLDRPETNLQPNELRKALRILNIFDMNIVPLNIHALRREIPFVSLFSYNRTFREMIKHTLGSEFMYNLNKGSKNYPVKFVSAVQASTPASMKHASLLTDALQTPYKRLLVHVSKGTPNQTGTYEVADILEICLGHADLPLGRPKFLSDEIVEKIMGVDVNSNLVLLPGSRTKDHAKPYIAQNAGDINNRPSQERVILDIFNNSTIRTLFYLVNLQRVIRLKMRQDMYWSLGPVVNNIHSISPDVTEITNDKRDYQPTRR